MEGNQKFILEQTHEMSNRKHILVIDDDLNMLKTLRYYLQDAYKVTVANEIYAGSDPFGLHDANV